MQPTPENLQSHIMAHGHNLTAAVDTLKFAPEHWHTTLLIELATENVFNSFELVQGSKAGVIGVCRCAWAARNLLELQYFTRFVLESPKNARRFFEDMGCDYQDLLKRIAKNPQFAQQALAPQAVLDHMWANHATQTKKKDKYLSARNIAEDSGEGLQFGDAHKFLSKFVHPTSLSIQFKKAPDVAVPISASMLQIAGNLVADTF
jgi:hypothetical protein